MAGAALASSRFNCATSSLSVTSVSIEFTPERNAEPGLRRLQQDIAQPRMAARELRLRKTHAAVEPLGDLVVRPAFDVVEPDDRARHGRQPCQRTIEVDEIGGAGFGF